MADSTSGQAPRPAPGGRLFRRRYVLYALAGLGAFLALAALLDAPVTRALTSWPPAEQRFFRALTEWGESDWVLIPTFGVWAVALLISAFAPLGWSTRWAVRAAGGMSGFVFVAVGLPGLISAILKRLTGRARPSGLEDYGTLWFDPWQPFAWSMQSFPSGHATTSFALAAAMVALFGVWLRPLYVLAALIALSRIVLGVHFLSDTIFGAALGTLGALAVRNFFAERRWVLEKRGDRLRNRLLAPLRRSWRRLTRPSPRDSA